MFIHTYVGILTMRDFLLDKLKNAEIALKFSLVEIVTLKQQVRIYMCMYICIHICMYGCLYVYMYACIYIYTLYI
jgi:hypothetical protein